MAPPKSLHILVIWVWITGLAQCQNATTPTATTPTPIVITATTNQNQTPTPTRTPTLTPTRTQNQNQTTATVSTTPTTTAPPPPAPDCSYMVTSNKFGLKVEIINATMGEYTIRVNEEGRPETTKTIRHQFSRQSSVYLVQHLKPCTQYQHSVSFQYHPGLEVFCSNSENGTTVKTQHMERHDIRRTSCLKGSVCYQSFWDLSASLETPNRTPTRSCSNATCYKPDYNDICSRITTTFKNTLNCVNGSTQFDDDITIDFLSGSEIPQSRPYELPAKIEATLPSKCVNLSVDYSCYEKSKDNVSLNLSELKPFTDYICTGQIKNNDVSINKTTTPVSVWIKCEFRATIKEEHITDTSIKLNWATSSSNCQSVLPDLEGLSYNCSCSPANTQKSSPEPKDIPAVVNQIQPGGMCEFTGLSPYTKYGCHIRIKYNNIIERNQTFSTETNPGTPVKISSAIVKQPEHNVIIIESCHYPEDHFKGPNRGFRAQLNDGKKEKNSTCHFEFRGLSYSTDYIVKLTAFNGVHESEAFSQPVSTSYNDKAVIGFLVFLIIATSLALLFVVYKIYVLKRKKPNESGENICLITGTNDEDNLMPVEPIASEVLLEAYKRKLADEGRLFLAEFQSIPRIFSRYLVKEAKKPCNALKNRYVDILPYDYNRVQLDTGNGEAGCDYINASFIDGYKEPKKYIAAQGPKDETVSDFWRMIWEQQSSIIVMVTRCEEGNRVKCAQYWPSPERETEIYEEFVVKLISEVQCPDYTIRRLNLINKRERNPEREVTHIQFISWPDHGVPGEPQLLLKLRRRVNAFKNFFSGPIVVHCSAGVGRTGTYISIDAMMESLEAEGKVDIYGYVVRLRRQRCLMVQVEPQYILIHQALLEHNQFGETEISLSELHSTLSALKQRNSDSEPTLMEEEFERLPIFKNWRTFSGGMTEENKTKNRSLSVIPYDYNRVLLKLDEGRSQESEAEEEESSDEEDEDSSKYINASHIEGYWGPRVFIVAQTPLKETMEDFWLMVYQKRVATIVMLSDSREGDEDGVYWDKERKQFGDVEVEVVSTDSSSSHTSRNMLVHHVKRKESRPVKHFQFLKWEDKSVPENPKDLTDMIRDIKVSRGSSKRQRNASILVHCNDGSSRSGVFCALWNILESAETEKLVDVFQVTKTLRKERQSMLPSLEHYQFLYRALEGVFPVQNGEVKPVSAPDSVQIVSETRTSPDHPADSTGSDQQGAPPAGIEEGEEEKKEEVKESSPPTETGGQQEVSNGPTVPAEV